MARLAGTDARDPRSRQIIVSCGMGVRQPAAVSRRACQQRFASARDNDGEIDARNEGGKIEYQDTTIRQPSRSWRSWRSWRSLVMMTLRVLEGDDTYTAASSGAPGAIRMQAKRSGGRDAVCSPSSLASRTAERAGGRSREKARETHSRGTAVGEGVSGLWFFLALER